MIGEYPKISCVMVTKGRPHLFRRSLDCYTKQVYNNKELVIISQASETVNHQLKGILQEFSSEHISFLEVPARLSLGAMRNLSVEVATGELVCQWDDDDVYHPRRVLTQYKAIQADKSAVASCYSEFLHFSAETNRLYWINQQKGTEDYEELVLQYPYKQFLTGSVVFRKRCFHDAANLLYPESGPCSSREEDLTVIQKLLKMGRVVPVAAGTQYIYVFHGLNTYNRHHHQMLFHKKRIYSTECLLNYRRQIEETLSLLGSSVDVCTTGLVDFSQPDSQLGANLVFRFENEV